jgi:hypothetical protein
VKFNIILEELLNEAMSPIEIHKKYYWDIPYKTYDLIVKADPQTKTNGKEIIKIGKFSKLLLLMYRNKNLLLEDLPKATEYLEYVYKYNIPVDINKISDLSVLYDMIQGYVAQEGTDFSKILGVLPKNEYKLLHNGNEWWVFSPLSERAACYLGVNTQWCTTWGPLSLNKSYRDRQSHYGRYSDDPIYIIINKKNTDDKYQFHFRSKQYMNPSDRQIDTGEFLSETPEIKHFFFPSFVNKDYENIDDEWSKIDILSTEDSTELIRITSGSEILKNPLINALLVDNDTLNDVISDPLCSDTNLVNGYVRFDIKKLDSLDGEVSEVRRELSHYEHEIYDSYDRILSDVRDNSSYEDNEWNENHIEPLFERYYNVNKDKIRRIFSIVNYDIFKQNYFDGFSGSEKITEEYFDRTARLSEGAYESYYEKERNKIEKYIKIKDDYYGSHVELNLPYMVTYLKYREDVFKIENDLEDFINSYLSHFDLGGEPEYYPYIEYVYPEYDKDNDMTNEIDKYFDEIFDNADVYKECSKYREKLNQVIKDVFKNEYVYENSHVRVELKSGNINCENGTVSIKFHNKDTNKKFEGDVKVENLASYATNYQLFESISIFKKNIL